MSVIKIRGRSDPVFRPYAVAKKIKQRKFGDDTVTPPISKASPSDLIDLGDEWSGSYGQIVSIELNDKPQPAQLQSEEDKPQTPEQKEANRKVLAEMRKDMEARGILKPRNGETKTTLSLTRSGLAEYLKKFGKEYEVPAGAEIIEDL